MAGGKFDLAGGEIVLAGGKIILTGGEIILAEVEKLFWQVEKLICCWLVVLVLPQRSFWTLCLVVGDPLSSEIKLKPL